MTSVSKLWSLLALVLAWVLARACALVVAFVLAVVLVLDMELVLEVEPHLCLKVSTDVGYMISFGQLLSICFY